MVISGTVRNGVIVLDQPGMLPEGTRVRSIVETDRLQASVGYRSPKSTAFHKRFGERR